MSTSLQQKTAGLSRWTIPELTLLSLALLSLVYAVVTAPGKGIDLGFFQTGAREWVDGAFRIGEGVIGVYTPFLLPLFSPMALLSFETLVVVWIVLNIAATVLSLHFVIKLWGKQWPIKTRLLLAAFFIAFAPFRVTLRNGQIGLMMMALLLGALLARRQKKSFLAGALLGLSLCKYTLTIPFFLYFVWKREWKVVSTAILVPLGLTEVFALRLGLPLFQVIRQYFGLASQILVSGLPGRTGTTEIRLLFSDLIGNQTVAIAVTLVFSIAALICMGVVFARKSRWEMTHFAAVALFSLWSVYHRTYDSVLCLLPAALMVDFLVHKRFIRFSRFWLAGLGLLIVSIPGVLVERLQMTAEDLSGNPLLMLGLHVERLLVFGMFWSLLFVMWKARTSDLLENELEREKEESVAAAVTVTPEFPLRSTGG